LRRFVIAILIGPKFANDTHINPAWQLHATEGGESAWLENPRIMVFSRPMTGQMKSMRPVNRR
jgi:hypothetical protein